MLFCGESVLKKGIRKRLRKKIIKLDNWTMGLVRDGNFRMAGGEEEGFGGVVVRVGGEDGEELGRSFSAGAGDEDCHVSFWFSSSYFFFVFFFGSVFLGGGRVGFGLKRERLIFLWVGDTGER